MFGRTSQKNFIPAASYRKARDVVFLELRNTVFCTECELIGYNNSSRCLACNSQAVLSLARVLGGSLHGEQRARVVQTTAAAIEAKPQAIPAASWSPEPAYAMAMHASTAMQSTSAHVPSGLSMLQFGVDRARSLTDASGAAIALREGPRLLCRARAGSTAP